jgi:ligand-binding sensor domain-containing protein
MLRRLGRLADLPGCLCCAWLLLAVACHAAAAASGNSMARSYTLRAWTAADGLPLGTIQSLTQSSDRYLWIGTDGGLVRFDGSTFQSVHALPQKSIFALLAGATDRCGSAPKARAPIACCMAISKATALRRD